MLSKPRPVPQCSPNLLSRQVILIAQDVFGHAGCDLREHGGRRRPSSRDDRLAERNLWIRCDARNDLRSHGAHGTTCVLKARAFPERDVAWRPRREVTGIVLRAANNPPAPRIICGK